MPTLFSKEYWLKVRTEIVQWNDHKPYLVKKIHLFSAQNHAEEDKENVNVSVLWGQISQKCTQHTQDTSWSQRFSKGRHVMNTSTAA